MTRQEMKVRLAMLGKSQLDIMDSIRPQLKEYGYKGLLRCEFISAFSEGAQLQQDKIKLITELAEKTLKGWEEDVKG